MSLYCFNSSYIERLQTRPVFKYFNAQLQYWLYFTLVIVSKRIILNQYGFSLFLLLVKNTCLLKKTVIWFYVYISSSSYCFSYCYWIHVYFFVFTAYIVIVFYLIKCSDLYSQNRPGYILETVPKRLYTKR